MKGPVLEKVLCDADILEIPTAGGKQDDAGQMPPDARKAAGGEQDAPGKGGTAGGEASAAGYTYPAGIDEPEGEETPLEQVNRLCQAYREKASLQRRSDGADGSREKKGHRSSKSTIPPSLRKKVLLRDGYRCPPYGGQASARVHQDAVSCRSSYQAAGRRGQALAAQQPCSLLRVP